MLKIYDTMSRGIRPVHPLETGKIKMYTCGPTVYRDVHLGNLRSYLMADWIRRTITALEIDVIHVKNITDVGHMRHEMVRSTEDKVVAAALDEGKTPIEISEFYTNRFKADERRLNICEPDVLPKATEHISEMISIIEHLKSERLAYESDGNIYFDIASLKTYGSLSGNTQDDGLFNAVRVEADPLKKNPRDFTLWKSAEKGRKLKWGSPWGEGFPGWHIECSAMSLKYLGNRFDIHTGGIDNIFPHHEDEIAQSDGFTGHRVVNTWVHGQHLLADGVKMSKSSGNSYTLQDVESRGIEPLAFRYLCLTAKYNTKLDFTFTSLKAAARALLHMRNCVVELQFRSKFELNYEVEERDWIERFLDTVSNDLNLPKALGLTWELLRSELPPFVKLEVVKKYDELLGLDLFSTLEKNEMPHDIKATVQERSTLRNKGLYKEADKYRDIVENSGYVLEDTANGTRFRPKTSVEMVPDKWVSVSSAAEVSSHIEKPAKVQFTVGLIADNYKSDVERAINSAINWARESSIEVVVLDNDSTNGTPMWLEKISQDDQRIRTIHTDHNLGTGSAMNIILKQSQGEIIILLDTSLEITGNIYANIKTHLSNPSIGVTGPFGLRSSDMQHFHNKSIDGDMDAMQFYCFAFNRSSLTEVGLMRESFRFYRNLDIDYSFQFKSTGLRIWADHSMPVTLHEHRGWASLNDAERDHLSLKNYRRFLNKWGKREDLLVSNRVQDKRTNT